jgi:hypothetical protein
MRTTTGILAPVQPRGDRPRPHRLPEARAARAGVGLGAPLRRGAHAHEPSQPQRRQPGLREEVDRVRRLTPCGPQYLVLGAKARALTKGRYHVSFEDISALAHPVLGTGCSRTSTPSRRGRPRRRWWTCCSTPSPFPSRACRGGVAAGHVSHPRRYLGHAVPRPGGPRPDREPAASGENRRGRLPDRAAPLALPGLQHRFRRAPAIHAGRRHPAHRLAPLGADGPALHQALRGRHQRELRRAARRIGSMSYGTHSLAKLDYARYLAACLSFFSSEQRDRVGLVTFDHEIVEYVPPSMKHLDTVLHLLDQAEAGRPGSLGAAPPGHGAARAEGNPRPHLRLLRGAGQGLGGDRPAQVARPRHDRLPRPGSGRARVPLRECLRLRGPRDRGADPRGAWQAEGRLQAHGGRAPGDARQTRFASNRIDYTLLDTSKPLDLALFQYLLAREAMRRTR